MSSSPSAPPAPSEAPIPDDPLASSALPLPLSASVMLSALPTDAHAALSAADDMEGLKIKIRFMPLPNVPALAKKIFQVSATNRFETVVSFLRKRLGVRAEQSVVCYVNSVFAPGLDEGVGALWKCFKTNFQGDEQLVVAYSLTPAFG